MIRTLRQLEPTPTLDVNIQVARALVRRGLAWEDEHGFRLSPKGEGWRDMLHRYLHSRSRRLELLARKRRSLERSEDEPGNAGTSLQASRPGARRDGQLQLRFAEALG